MDTSSYFDSLPLHPRPRMFESFSSLVLRVAEANGIQSVRVLSALLGVSAATLIHLSDYPLLSFGTISTRTSIAQEDLLATTFYHLGKKFGRSTRPSPLARFLRGSLASQLRYCPACLLEHGHYCLTYSPLSPARMLRSLWRFSPALRLSTAGGRMSYMRRRPHKLLGRAAYRTGSSSGIAANVGSRIPPLPVSL